MILTFTKVFINKCEIAVTKLFQFDESLNNILYLIYLVDFILNNSNFVEFVLSKKSKAKLVKFIHVIDTEIC